MKRDGKQWREFVAQAEAYKALDQREHYLDNQKDYPWEFVVKCEPGGSHRIDISTNVWFSAEHPCGLRFRWSFDIEPYSANGSSSYHIDTDSIAAVLRVLPTKAAADFQNYLKACADAVQKNADGYFETATREQLTARELRRMSQIQQL